MKLGLSILLTFALLVTAYAGFHRFKEHEASGEDTALDAALDMMAYAIAHVDTLPQQTRFASFCTTKTSTCKIMASAG